MIFKKTYLLVLILSISVCIFSYQNSNAGNDSLFTGGETDSDVINFRTLFYYFDLRDRETFIQLTYNDGFGTGLNGIAHIQIFNVDDNCNENDFFDNYTINDTHVYDMRNIQTNDGNPSGVALSEGAYGFVAITVLTTNFGPATAFGNFRILDDNGYEYRTNAQAYAGSTVSQNIFNYQLNFNNVSGITLSDVVGITVNRLVSGSGFNISYQATDIIDAFNPFDIDIINNNEVPFSCRNIIFSCVNEDNPRLEELLEFSGSASVASFEYGINNAIPHSKGGELLCPGNTTQEGIVILSPLPQPINPEPFAIFLGFVGLNNGDGRGSMDSFWNNGPVFGDG